MFRNLFLLLLVDLENITADYRINVSVRRSDFQMTINASFLGYNRNELLPIVLARTRYSSLNSQLFDDERYREQSAFHPPVVCSLFPTERFPGTIQYFRLHQPFGGLIGIAPGGEFANHFEPIEFLTTHENAAARSDDFQRTLILSAPREDIFENEHCAPGSMIRAAILRTQSGLNDVMLTSVQYELRWSNGTLVPMGWWEDGLEYRNRDVSINSGPNYMSVPVGIGGRLERIIVESGCTSVGPSTYGNCNDGNGMDALLDSLPDLYVYLADARGFPTGYIVQSPRQYLIIYPTSIQVRFEYGDENAVLGMNLFALTDINFRLETGQISFCDPNF